ncbi:uncharacterized protein [Hoplias malabaricus]|uniref:uncharacterized protein isoform X2 n=1 Tax=Hoplias malabaricus TaxID=27720 RepID=UPI003462EF69
MRVTVLSLTVLLLAATICQAVGPGGRCLCLRTSRTVLQPRQIKSYQVQKSGLCQINAIVFFTVRGKQICSDPTLQWVKNAMASVDARQRISSATATPQPQLNNSSTTSAPQQRHNISATAFKPTWITTASSWPPDCCLRVSNQKIHAKYIAFYTVYSSGLCPVNAIAFWTLKGKKLCSNPDLDWVKKLMKKVGPKSAEKKGSTAGPAAAAKPQNRKGKRKGKKPKKTQQ